MEGITRARMTILADRNATRTARAGSKCKRLDPNDEDRIETRHVACSSCLPLSRANLLKRNVYSSRGRCKSARAVQRNVQDRAPCTVANSITSWPLSAMRSRRLALLAFLLFFLDSSCVIPLFFCSTIHDRYVRVTPGSCLFRRLKSDKGRQPFRGKERFSKRVSYQSDPTVFRTVDIRSSNQILVILSRYTFPRIS